jgi:hypothetical protein
MFEDYLFTKNTKWVLWGLFALVVALLIFRAGTIVGYHDALRFHGLESRGGPQDQGPFGLPLPPDGGMPGHGAVGTIESVALPTVTLKTRDGSEVSVYVASTTPGVSQLKVGETIVVIGDPNDTDQSGDMNARFIHIIQQ